MVAADRGTDVLKREGRMLKRLLLTSVIAWFAIALPQNAEATTLPDGTRVTVRLVGYIDSNRSQAGDALEFVVTKDVMADGNLVIRKGTRVNGVVLRAKRSHWGFVSHHAKL